MLRIALGLAAALLAPLPAAAELPLHYAKPEHWVCHPSQPHACQDDLRTAVIQADGAVRIEPFRPTDRPKADCFYVYPTVSHSPGLTAEPIATESERRAVRQQVERLTSVCRLIVPVYRQLTLAPMKNVTPRPTPAQIRAAGQRAQDDVLAAWDHYVAQDNGGRPVVLIGHSQGAAMVINLIQQRIDGRPIQAQLVSAIVPGFFVMVPTGKTIGGTFKAIPPCRADTETGCVIAYNAVRAERPIPADMIRHVPGQTQVCTNPAALGGGAGVLKPYLSTAGETIIPDLTAPQEAWTRNGGQIDAPFVTTPGLYSAECSADGAYLAISPTAAPGDQRTGALTGDWLVDGQPEPTMGLHLLDLNLTAGNLADILRRQIAAMPKR